MESISIIGLGRVGGALSIGLTRAGYRVRKLFARDMNVIPHFLDKLDLPPEVFGPADLGTINEDAVFISTQDANVRCVAEALFNDLEECPDFVFHVSGSLSSEILGPLRSRGIKVGSIHPLISISDPETGAARLKDARYCIEGDQEAVIFAQGLVSKLGGISFSIDTKYKPLYHASAVFAAGHLVALIDIATELLGKCGIDKENTKEILMPLIESTVGNIRGKPLSKALTGPFARADIETLVEHIRILIENASPELIDIYLQLGNRSLDLAEANLGDQIRINKMREIISKTQKMRS